MSDQAAKESMSKKNLASLATFVDHFDDDYGLGIWIGVTRVREASTETSKVYI